jgi:SAM-dependent methyltransferase
MLIRWVPSVVHLVAYYANLMLLSSFLGLGVGSLAGEKRRSLFNAFPAFLALDILALLLCRNVSFGATATEARFSLVAPALLNNTVPVLIFSVNALVFVPLGQRMGVLFNSLPRLAAYGWDLAGGLCGTLVFGLFSLRFFSPLLGMGCVMLVYLGLTARRRWLLDVPVFAAVLALMFFSDDHSAIWSPYYYITVHRLESPGKSETGPVPNLMTMRNPPVYGVKVNQFGYHWDMALDPARYDPADPHYGFVVHQFQQYSLPYQLSAGRDRALIVGAGGGADVQAALLAGVKHVDAVEIDPAIIETGRRFSAGAPYSDPRVQVHIDDGRSYMARASPDYDMVVLGFLDSQALFSSMSSVRLDGYVYTVESLRSAYRLLKPHGLLSLSFYVTRDWLGPKLYSMLAEATGRRPIMYLSNRQMVLCVPKDDHLFLPPRIFYFEVMTFTNLGSYEVPTDDWPFLYLSERTVPSDYLIGISGLLVVSLLSVLGLSERAFGKQDLHFAFLGMGFLLLETKSISDCTLYFGATWLVTTIVVVGVLAMVMAANLISAQMRRFSLWSYAPLFAALVFLLLVPRGEVLQFPRCARLAWALLVVPLPVLFAGIIFSLTFRDAPHASSAFGANLIGAMIGGLAEYLGMALGYHRLSLLIVVAYLASLAVLTSRRKLAEI